MSDAQVRGNAEAIAGTTSKLKKVDVLSNYFAMFLTTTSARLPYL